MENMETIPIQESKPEDLLELLSSPRISNKRANSGPEKRDNNFFDVVRSLSPEILSSSSSKLAFPEKTGQFQFNIHYSTRFGQRLAVVGSVPGLGNWNVSEAPKMTWLPGGFWTLTITLPLKFSYKYAVVDEVNSGDISWEACGDREIDERATPNISWVTIEDYWGTSRNSIKTSNIQINNSTTTGADTEIIKQEDVDIEKFNSEELFNLAIQKLKEGAQSEKIGDIVSAIELYELSDTYFRKSLTSEKDDQRLFILKNKLRRIWDFLIVKVIRLRAIAANQKILSQDEAMRKFVLSGIFASKSHYGASELVGQEMPWYQLYESIRNHQNQPKGILVHGPPNSGKSHLVECAAMEFGCTLFQFDSRELNRWSSSPERFTKILFEVLNKFSPNLLQITDFEHLDPLFRKLFLIRMPLLPRTTVQLIITTTEPWRLDKETTTYFTNTIYVAPFTLSGRRILLGRLFDVDVGYGGVPIATLSEMTRACDGLSYLEILDTLNDVVSQLLTKWPSPTSISNLPPQSPGMGLRGMDGGFPASPGYISTSSYSTTPTSSQAASGGGRYFSYIKSKIQYLFKYESSITCIAKEIVAAFSQKKKRFYDEETKQHIEWMNQMGPLPLTSPLLQKSSALLRAQKQQQNNNTNNTNTNSTTSVEVRQKGQTNNSTTTTTTTGNSGVSSNNNKSSIVAAVTGKSGSGHQGYSAKGKHGEFVHKAIKRILKTTL